MKIDKEKTLTDTQKKNLFLQVDFEKSLDYLSQ
jgi:hypothetical protein